MDTTRADRMGFLGSSLGLSPHLDSLAGDSVVFLHAYSQVPLTTPSHATLLTGTFPQFNHVRNLGDRLAKDIPFLPEVLRARGYATGAFVASSVLDPKGGAPGFDRGFSTYDAGFHRHTPGEDRYQSVERRGAVVVDHAIAWLKRQPKGRPVLLWVHLYDPHYPYDPPEPYKSQHTNSLYDGEVAYMDSAVGKLVDALRAGGMYQNAIVAAMADHGEALGEHGEREHGVFLYDETIRVPLLIKLPGNKRAGEKIETRAGLVDVAPTILRVLRIPVPTAMQGTPLMGSPEGNLASGEAADRPAYAESEYGHDAFGWAPLHSWRTGKYLYIQAPQRELYDQGADPEAARNLAPQTAAVADTLASQLQTFQDKTARSEAPRAALSAEAANNLRALGYVTSGAASKAKKDSGADPKGRIETANLMHEALVDMEDQNVQKAIPKFQQAIKVDPTVAPAYLELGNALLQAKQPKEAIPPLRKALELMPESGTAHDRLGQALVETEDWAGAAREFEAALALSPKSPELHVYLGGVYEKLDRAPDATKEYQTAADLAPDDFRANLLAGRRLGMNGDAAAALPYLQKATILEPTSPDAHQFLANVYRALGHTSDADREREEAQRLKQQPHP